MAAIGLLAADRNRSRTGKGSLVKLALSDVAFATVAHLGRLAQAELGAGAEKDGNYLYGAFGKDFLTKDGRRIMVIALTGRQWKALRDTTGIDVAAIAAEAGANLDTEGGRYAARDAIEAALSPWIAARNLDEVKRLFTAKSVSWGPYQSFRQLLTEDLRVSENPMFGPVAQPDIGTLTTPASPLDFSSAPRLAPAAAPRLGEHTDQVLSELGYSNTEISALHDRQLVAGP
jgi:2-methylfumaryl-CoA isomerase